MELGAYQPTLGKIQEEPDDSEDAMYFDDSILSEYAIPTDEELKRASYIVDPGGEMGCIWEDKASKSFPAIHTDIGTKNNQIIRTKYEGAQKNNSVNERRNDGVMETTSNTSIVNIICENDDHRILDITNSECDYESTYNFLNGSDSGIHNTDNSSICSTTNSLSINPSINESLNRSLNGSINGSLFNLDKIVNFSSSLPVEQRVIDFNTAIGRKVFSKATRQKYMNIYYVLSQQRLCGDFIGNESVAAFVMVLKALEIRQTELKGTYFKTHSLDDEMSFADIASVAKDNSLSAEISQVFKDSCLANFRKAVKLSCKSTNILLLCCYHIEEAHAKVNYSFIGGYYKDNDAVLLVTPSKSRFHTRWLPILLMWKILTSEARTDCTDQTQTAGYMLLQRNERNPRIAIRINKSALLCLEAPATSRQNTQDFQRLLASWTRWLELPATDVTDDVILQAINYAVNNVNLQKNAIQFGIAHARRTLNCRVDSLTDIISKTKVYKAVKNQIDSLSPDNLKKLEVFSEWISSMTYPSSVKSADKKIKAMNFKKIRRKQSPKSHTSKIIYKDNLMLAMCLVFWPYSVDHRGTNAASLAQSVHSDLALFPWDTMLKMQDQIRFVVTVMQYSFNDGVV